jgi:hypothetical protein
MHNVRVSLVFYKSFRIVIILIITTQSCFGMTDQEFFPSFHSELETGSFFLKHKYSSPFVFTIQSSKLHFSLPQTSTTSIRLSTATSLVKFLQIKYSVTMKCSSRILYVAIGMGSFIVKANDDTNFHQNKKSLRHQLQQQQSPSPSLLIFNVTNPTDVPSTVTVQQPTTQQTSVVQDTAPPKESSSPITITIGDTPVNNKNHRGTIISVAIAIGSEIAFGLVGLLVLWIYTRFCNGMC